MSQNDASKSALFRKSQRTKKSTSARESFNTIFNNLISYLNTIDFDSMSSTPKLNTKNYKYAPKKVKFTTPLTIEQLSQIEQYIIALSKPGYQKFLDQIIIPSRPIKPNLSSIPEDQRDKILQEYQSKLYNAEKEIKLKTFIKELVKNYQIYNNDYIKEYYVYLCTTILLSYCEDHPYENTKIHFRFKSPSGIITKLATNIILNGSFEYDPKSQTDKFIYSRITDAFGAKIVSKKGFSPYASSDPEIKDLIEKRNELQKECEEFDLFQEKIDNLINGHKNTQITYSEYIQNCISILEKIIEIINKKETTLINSLQEKIIKLEFQKQLLNSSASLDECINDLNFIENPDFSFKNFYAMFKSKLHTPLAVAGLKRGLNKIFFNNGQTKSDILQKSLLDLFQINIISSITKNTASGHEAIHIDIQTPFGPFELQVQTEEQYIYDQVGETAAHTLMQNKDIQLLEFPDSPKDVQSSKTVKKSSFLTDKVKKFKTYVECLSAKKGVIKYNKSFQMAQIEFYSSLYNYFSVGMERPDSDPYKDTVKEYFKKLFLKSYELRKALFKHVDPLVYSVPSSQIETVIRKIIPFYPKENNSPNRDNQIHSL